MDKCIYDAGILMLSGNYVMGQLSGMLTLPSSCCDTSTVVLSKHALDHLLFPGHILKMGITIS